MVFNKYKKYISIGKTSILKGAELNFDYNRLNEDGFFIKTIGNLIIIDSFNNRGTLYGVYDFLEKYVGVRFISAETTYIPKHNKIEIGQLDIIERPDFMFRHFLAGDIWLGTEDPYMQRLACRMRMSHEQQETPEEFGGGPGWYDGTYSKMHNTLEYVPPALYEKDYPEMYWYMDGKPAELCLSNGITDDGKIDHNLPMSSAKAVLSSLKEFIKKDSANTI